MGTLLNPFSLAMQSLLLDVTLDSLGAFSDVLLPLPPFLPLVCSDAIDATSQLHEFATGASTAQLTCTLRGIVDNVDDDESLGPTGLVSHCSLLITGQLCICCRKPA